MPAVAKRQNKPPEPPALEPIEEPPLPRKPRKTLAEMAGDLGIACRKCGCRDLRVYYTRPAGQSQIKRVKLCRHCGTRVVTYEREAFSREQE